MDLQASFSVGEDGVESMRRLMKQIPAEGRKTRKDENEKTRGLAMRSVDTLPVGVCSEMTMIPWGRRNGT